VYKNCAIVLGHPANEERRTEREYMCVLYVYKFAITFAAHFHNVNVLLSNSTFLIFAVLVVCCRPCRLWRLF